MNKKIRFLLLFSLLHFLHTGQAGAQQASSFINRAPEFLQITPPTVASFNKFIDHPVSLYTGTPDISLPVYELTDGDIQLSAVLRYNSSGIRVKEEAGWVGLGWNLNAGGYISQQVVGEDDDNTYDARYDELVKLLAPPVYPSPYSATHYSEKLHKDMECYRTSSLCQKHMGKLTPDVFYFSVPGYQGKFVVDYTNNNKVVLLNREQDIDIDVRYSSSGSTSRIGYFALTTPEGVRHEFAYFAQMTSAAGEETVTSRTFVLTESEYPNGQTIHYTYRKAPYSYTHHSAYYQSSYEPITSTSPIFLGTGYYGTHMQFINGDEVLLESIRTTNYQVKFTLGNRQDLNNGQRLEKIQISSLQSPSTILREVRFDYTYFNAGGFDPLQNYRLRLEKMYTCVPSTGKAEDVYGFTYNTLSLPAKNSSCRDYWGYYNGSSDTGYRLPSMRKLYFSRNVPDLLNVINAPVADRSAHASYTAAGMLEGITYPTGGYTRFEYESNTFTGEYIPNNADKQREIIMDLWDRNGPSDRKDVYFNMEHPGQVEIVVTLQKGLNNWLDLQNSNVVLLSINPVNIIERILFSADCQQYHNSNNSAPQIKKTVTVDLPKGSYHLVASFPDALGEQSGPSRKNGSLTVTASYLTVSNEHSTGCGVRIKSITSCPSKTTTTPIKTTHYEYTHPTTGKSSGILHDQLYFLNTHHTHNSFVIERDLNTPVPIYTHVNIRQIELGSENKFSNPYGHSSGVGYSFVTEKTSTLDSYGYAVHEFNNAELKFTQNSFAIDNPLNGKPRSVKIYDKDKKLLSHKEYTYKQALRYSLYGTNVEENYNRFPRLYSSPMGYYLRKDPNYHSPNCFFIMSYLIPAYDITLASESETTDGVTTQTQYTYDTGTLQLKEKKITSSDGKTLRHTYTYANNYSATPYIRMKQSHRYKEIIEEKVFMNNYFIAAQLNQYDASTYPMLQNQYFSEIRGTQTDVTSYSSSGTINTAIYPTVNIAYRERDSYGRVRQLTRDNLFHTVYLWGYNSQYPIAKIEGALTYQQVKAKVTEAYINNLAANHNITQTTLKELRDKLAGESVQITTYTYKPLFGITSVMNPNKDLLNYTYDSFGRLMKITDLNGKTVEEYQYNYKP